MLRGLLFIRKTEEAATQATTAGNDRDRGGCTLNIGAHGSIIGKTVHITIQLLLFRTNGWYRERVLTMGCSVTRVDVKTI